MRRISPSFVISVLALIVAMSGTAYAANELSKNSVSTKALKKNAVTTSKIKNDAVTGAKIKDGTLTSDDFAPGTVLQGPQGEAGAQGPQGAPGIDATIPSAYASSTATNAMSTSYATVLQLTQGYTASGSIAITQPSRLVISSVVTVYGKGPTDGGGSPLVGTVLCRPQILQAATPVGLETNSDSYGSIPPTSSDTQQSLSVVGTASVSPGTYDAFIECRTGGGTLAVTLGGSLSVTAIPSS